VIGLKTSSGTYIFWNTIGTTTETAGTVGTITANPDASNNGVSSQATNIYGQWQDGIFALGASLTAVPTVANVGGSVAITGAGLPAATTFELGMQIAGVGSGSTPTTCALTGVGHAAQPTVVLGAFTTTASGTVPATSVTVTDNPTATGLEQGTLYCVFAQTASVFGTGTATGTAKFLLQATGNENMTSAPIGHNVIMSAHALAANTGYNILFAPYVNPGTSNEAGTVVGALLSNQNGAGSATFTVPGTVNTASGSTPTASGGSYSVQLVAVGGTTAALAAPPTLTVGSVSTTSCQSTTCMVANGAPALTTIGANKAVQTSFTNNSNAPVTAIVYAVVHNAAGQTVSYSTATVTAAAGASATAYDVLFGLAPGTYSVTIFATSTSGTAISTTSTVSVTV